MFQVSCCLEIKSYIVYPLPITIYSTLRAHNKELCKFKKGGIRMKKQRIIAIVLKVVTVVIAAVFEILRAIGLFGKSARAAA